MFSIFHRHRAEPAGLVEARRAAQQSAAGVKEARKVREDAANDRYTLAEIRRRDHVGTRLFGEGA
jgi:hypothetical protein